MNRSRFFQLLRYFHIANNQQMPAANDNREKFCKIRPLLSTLQSISPEEYQAIDEQMIPFKNRSSLKQYVNHKPHKWGYESFTRARVSGMTYDLKIYVDKITCNERGLGFSGDNVLALTDSLPEKQQHKVFADN
ncbi:hypothetical protein ILUMI_15691 [Ignelater luminosus]|uniref:PiggyBac transposable element-derived protein domain-containing protein n=1 Tax=Ignelater luminosus TaxID=2038154 RepID=A0A8K0CU93_IGNLU|nr:hypothetical protein ILUMI_15691 [Ignelater luminosus]